MMTDRSHKEIIFFVLTAMLFIFPSVWAKKAVADDDLLPGYLIMQDLFKPGYGKSVGSVVLVSGQAVILHENRPEGYLAGPDTPLFKNDTIVTLENSSVEIRFNDRSRLSIEEKTKFRINKCGYDADRKDRSVFVTMMKGRIRFLVTKLLQFRRSEFKVKTRTCVAGVRGSDFVVLAEEEQTRITALDDTQLAITNSAMPEEAVVFLNSFERVSHRLGETIPEPEEAESDIIDNLKQVLPFSESFGETQEQEEDFSDKLVRIPEDQLIPPGSLSEIQPEATGDNRNLETLEELRDMERIISDRRHEDYLENEVWEIPPFPDPP